MPTLADVARQARVSIATASRVLSGSRQRVVGDELRVRVLAAARDLQFVPNANARALARSAAWTVGVIVHDIADPYFAAIARGVLEVATRNDLLVSVCTAYREPARQLAYVASLRAQRVQAVVLAGSGFEDPTYVADMSDELRRFRAAGGRAVCISRHGLGIDAVLPDNRGGGAAMARVLLDAGHRRFGVVTGPTQLTTVQDRYGGFVDVLAGVGVTLSPDHVVDGHFTRDGGYDAALALLDRAPRISALFALNDLMAVGALSALRSRGVAIPGQVAVAGFDDIDIARDVTPALTTVRLPMSQMGALALTLALERDREEPREVAVATDVVLRASTASSPQPST